MKRFLHKEYDFEKGCFPLDYDLSNGWEYPEVFASQNPDETKYNVDTDPYQSAVIAKDAEGYVLRRESGVQFADFMQARLLLIESSLKSAGIPDDINEFIRAKIDFMFIDTEVELRMGKWKSAQREIKKLYDIAGNVITNKVLQSKLDEYQITLIVQDNLVNEIKSKIDESVNNLY